MSKVKTMGTVEHTQDEEYCSFDELTCSFDFPTANIRRAASHSRRSDPTPFRPARRQTSSRSPKPVNQKPGQHRRWHILFGMGSPAGAVDPALNRAKLGRDFNRAETRYGNNDPIRGPIDLNRMRIPDGLALRMAGLADDDRYKQGPAFEHTRRRYGAVTFEPFRTAVFRRDVETDPSELPCAEPTVSVRSCLKLRIHETL